MWGRAWNKQTKKQQENQKKVKISLVHLWNHIKTGVWGDFWGWNALPAAFGLWLNKKGVWLLCFWCQMTATAATLLKSWSAMSTLCQLGFVLKMQQVMSWLPPASCGLADVTCRGYFGGKSVMVPAIMELGKNFCCWYLFCANPRPMMGEAALLSTQCYSLPCVCVMYCRHVNQSH